MLCGYSRRIEDGNGETSNQNSDLFKKIVLPMKIMDLKKDLSGLYKVRAGKIDVVTVPDLTYLMCDGIGNPNTSLLFSQATEALFSLSYTIKFMVKKGELQTDYSVMPLEGLWWVDDMSEFSTADKDKWKWTLMILQPDFVTSTMVQVAKEQVRKKKGLAMIDAIRLEKMNEGLCAQIQHIGPYSTEAGTIANLHTFIKDNGYKLRGKHREIYLNDMRRTAPEKLKTIIRQPIEK
jgi:hypothetical protein